MQSRQPLISVVLGTLNRQPFLHQALQSIECAVGDLPWELIVIDGGSTDGTWEYLCWGVDHLFDNHPPVAFKKIQQEKRTGAVVAYNMGFRMAEGTYVAAFNDDAQYIGKPLAGAFLLLRKRQDIGQVAIPFTTNKIRHFEEMDLTPHKAPKVAEVNLEHYGRVPYANFGVIRRALGERVGWWGDYYHYAGDTHLSASVWYAGLKVEPLSVQSGYIVHFEVQDETRLPNVETTHFDAVWRNPKKPKPMPNLSEVTFRHVLYVGNAHGKERYQRPGSEYSFEVNTQHRLCIAPPEDAEYLLKLRKHGRPLFQLDRWE